MIKASRIKALLLILLLGLPSLAYGQGKSGWWTWGWAGRNAGRAMNWTGRAYTVYEIYDDPQGAMDTFLQDPTDQLLWIHPMGLAVHGFKGTLEWWGGDDDFTDLAGLGSRGCLGADASMSSGKGQRSFFERWVEDPYHDFRDYMHEKGIYPDRRNMSRFGGSTKHIQSKAQTTRVAGQANANRQANNPSRIINDAGANAAGRHQGFRPPKY